jgi:superoxide reductase
MKESPEFFICNTCDNLINFIENSGVPIICCGAPMSKLTANTKEASTEKHLPVVSASGNEVHVAVGSVLHPMEEAHYISFIYLETAKGGQLKKLNPGEEPKASFALSDDTAIAAYEYCNLHGLWKTAIA